MNRVTKLVVSVSLFALPCFAPSVANGYPAETPARDLTVTIPAYGGRLRFRGVETDAYNRTKDQCLAYVMTDLNWNPIGKGNLSSKVQFSGALLHVTNVCGQPRKLRVMGAVVEKTK
jgi:hypothetical protein